MNAVQVALVSQEPTLFARSVTENILYGIRQPDDQSSEATQAIVEQAAMMANAHDFISGFADGYDTEVVSIHSPCPL